MVIDRRKEKLYIKPRMIAKLRTQFRQHSSQFSNEFGGGAVSVESAGTLRSMGDSCVQPAKGEEPRVGIRQLLLYVVEKLPNFVPPITSPAMGGYLIPPLIGNKFRFRLDPLAEQTLVPFI